jgi:hypothetical protein
MLNAINRPFPAVVLVAALMAFVAGDALAQSKGGGGKIVCWKDKSGKTIGCGDKVPPEYQDNATKELDRRGITRKTTETAEERAKREAQEREQAAQKAEEKKRLAERKRQDGALINTFSDAKEIDLKRDRDLQVTDTQLTQMRVAHKNATAREQEIKSRIEKAKGTPSEYNKDELARAEADKAKAEKGIAAKEEEMEDIRKRYAEMKQRYIQLKGGGTPAPKTAAAPAKK